MAPPRVDLEPYKSLITKLYTEESWKRQDIVDYLNQQSLPFQKQISLGTFKRALEEWGLKSDQVQRSENLSNPLFIQRVYTYYLVTDDNDRALAHRLQKEGWMTSETQIWNIRHQQGWKRKLYSLEQLNDRFLRTYERIHQIASTFGRAWGRSLMLTQLQLEGFDVRRDDVQAALQSLNEQYARDRGIHFKKKRRHEAIFQGPDDVWSVDGHDKFSRYGLTIYAAVDAHSRRLLWIYVGPANRIQICVAKQYLEAVRTYNVCPQRIRSDRGTETVMMANFQWAFYRQHLRNTGCTNEEVEKAKFQKAYLFGTSTRNIRIESFWGRLLKHQTYCWLVSLPLCYNESKETASWLNSLVLNRLKLLGPSHMDPGAV